MYFDIILLFTVRSPKMNSEELLLYICVLQKKILLQAVDRSTAVIKLKKLVSLYFLKYKNKNKIMRKRRYWVHPIFSTENRNRHGASNNLIKELYFYNDEKYINYFRMNGEVFDKLLTFVGPHITKQECVREAISSKTRLEICLRYLASGDSMKSLSYAFRVGHNTISKIVFETCEAIWIALKEEVFEEFREDKWKEIAKGFEEMWNFPNCIGAIDGKHVIIQVC